MIKKFLTIIYYSGHGGIEFATLRVTLDDCVYPLELKIRQFKNDNPSNTYNIGVFDTCRWATDDSSHIVGAMRLNGGIPYENDFKDFTPKDSNLILVFSSEPTNTTSDNGKATPALVEFLMKKKQNNGQVLIPQDLMYFNHNGQTEVTICCSGPLALVPIANQQPVQPAQTVIPQTHIKTPNSFE